MKLNHLFLSAITLMTISSSDLVAQNLNVNNQGVAINGYDVVNYYSTHSALRGSKEMSFKHNGATYYFNSKENLQAFQKDPSKYLPEYGGYCAFAMAMKGSPAPVDPQTFKLRDGKLYLFFNDFYEGAPFNTIVPWNSNEKQMIEKASNNFNKL